MSDENQNNNQAPKRKAFSEMTEIERENYKKRRDVMIKKKLQQIKDEETLEGKEQIFEQVHSSAVTVKPTTFKGKWANFWYHYKLTTWIIVFIAVLVGFFIYDMVTKPVYDYDIMVMSEIQYPTEYINAAQAEIIPLAEDLNSDGEINVMLQSSMMTDDQSADPNMVMAGQVKVSSALSEGINLIYVVDDFSYEFLKAQEVEFYDLSQISDNENIYGDKFSLKDTPSFSDMVLDDSGLYLVIRAPEGVYTDDAESANQRFEEQLALVEKIIQLQ